MRRRSGIANLWNEVIAVRNGFPKGPGGLKQSPSPLQSPLSTDSSPSPIVPFQSLLEDRTRKLSPSELPSERGVISFTLSYDPVSLALQVGVVECRNLCELVVSRDGQCLLDPYVKLQLLPEREHRVKTRIVRSTTCPKYDEQFTMYGVTSEQITQSTLHFQVPYEKKSFKLLEISTCSGTLKSVDYSILIPNFSKPKKLVRFFSPFPDPYVKLYLRRENGERIVKKKTHVRRSTVNPVYNESFVFELPETKMDNAVIDLQVINHDRSNRNDVIGRALLNLEDQHVVEVLENPGRQVAQWHHLD
ncbi:C2 domain protein [Necator americanus]|uniref:C2 domain protein n=1 Tax=Necator americanus TaxID=51031 RepID=W2TTJ0_NECAM|nr:C2 domain protein [Necator americanus]ETN85385.1 C2 domain protein [Necator americanus]